MLLRTLPFLACLAFATACWSSKPPEGKPLDPVERAEAESARDPRIEPLDVDGQAELVIRLDQTLSQWHAAHFSPKTREDRELSRNLAEVLHATVYKHFDDAMTLLIAGDDYEKTVLAAAIGFVRPPLIEDPDSKRADAASLDYQRAVEPLLALLHHEDARIVQNALIGLWLLRDPTIPTEGIFQALRHENVDVRANAALALSTILTPATGHDALDLLLTASADRSPRVRVQAITALRAVNDPNSAGRLLKLLNDPYELVAANAVRALAELGDVRNVGSLVGRLQTLDAETPKGTHRETTDLDRRRTLLRVMLIEALEKLTGERLGDNVEDWVDWWESHRP